MNTYTVIVGGNSEYEIEADSYTISPEGTLKFFDEDEVFVAMFVDFNGFIRG